MRRRFARPISFATRTLRDEGEAYGRKLREAGVDVAATRYEGIIHDFLKLDPMRDSHAARAATGQIVACIRGRLTRA